MKYIVFIIVFLNTFSNIFAWRFDHDCTDISIVDIKFIQNNQVEVTVHGPQRVSHPGYYPCCLQQGPMIIGNYKIYTNNPNDPIATIWVDRQWVNGYSEDNLVDSNNCVYGPQPDCDKVYQGAIDYTRTYDFDASRFPPPGGKVTLSMDIYAHCTFDSNYQGSTSCYQGCSLNYIADYNPQK
ncbi:hypothetical protein RhiirA5_507713 [Rhizophagus irregularis]|uniref:Uncharacterized protein n=1 Tax=Rhizophagus irregularis TaxID=588596 RepID=A0A2N0NHT6_9GLOM|nr:hypothetical protein RhiirA5_507713 [Rhizophagus irregularis]CAB4490590.1 unnamed protein product [Rhizophagus irregularis]